MTRGRRRFVPQPNQQAPEAKAKRLSRSFRRTQRAAEAEAPGTERPSDLKTPTRVCRSRPVRGSSGESPVTEADLQQDIVWDAGSPSPDTLGTRSRKHVDISELVSRIAPKHGRPKVAEPTLQRWIGDSATVPCTPDVQAPRPKKKSPRSNAVDDLLKLAKQFDLNMFHQDEERVEATYQQSLDVEGDNSASLPRNREAGVNVAAAADVDELDFLFDGPTQHVSGSLSQMSAAQPSHFRDASGKLSSPPASATFKGPSATGEFVDDWDDDDLLNDSLVFEMTQHPQMFDAPTHCSTQRPASEAECETRVGGDVRLDQSADSAVEDNPDFSVTRILKDTWTSTKVETSSDVQQSRCSSGSASSVSQETVTKTTQSFPKGPEVVWSSNATPAVLDFLDEDLESFFSSDPVWDDPADDGLLCEMCEDLENQVQSSGHLLIKQPLPDVQVSEQRSTLQPSNRTWHTTQRAAPVRGGGPAGSSLAASHVSAGVQAQTKTTSGSTGSSGVQSAAAAATDRFAFKKPNDPVSTVTNTVVAKCSALEIELKKQQAMERRRQRRLQAAQNLRAPT